MSRKPDPDRALRDGWLASLRACSLPAHDPIYLVVWRRGKWWIIGAAILALEAIVMSGLGSTVGTHF